MTTPLDHLSACLRGDVRAGTDWFQVIEAANQHLIAPRLSLALQEVAPSDAIEPEALAYLDELRRLNGERNHRFARQLEELGHAMNRAGVVPMVIKGAARLADADDARTVPRMLSDLDVVVAPSDVARANGALRDLGYDIFPDSADEHSCGSYFRKQDVGAVDLHFQLADRIAQVITPKDLSTRTSIVQLGRARLRVPDRTLQVAMNIAHDMLHDEGLSKGALELRYLLDLVDLTTQSDAPLDATWLRSKCRNWKFDLAVELQSRMMRDLLSAPPLPAHRRTRLGAALHRRRLWKERHGRLAKLEWDAVWRVKNLLRRLRLDPTPLLARWRTIQRRQNPTG